MRFVSLACIALVLALAGCIEPEESTDGGSGSGVWVQTDIAGADLDGDGRTDVVTLASQQVGSGTPEGFLKLYRQTTSGGFVTSEIRVGRHPWRLKIADVNGDGAPDLLVLDVVGGTGINDDVLYLLLQDANSRGRFLPARTVATGLSASDFVVTDANLDLAPDVVTAGIPGGGTGAAQYLQRLASRGDFATPTTLAIEGRVAKVVAADVGGSGRADLVSYSVLDSASASPGQLVVNYSTLLAGVGPGTFFSTPGRVMASYTGLNAQSIAVADVDGNGLADIVTCFTPVSSAFAARISVVLQRPLNQVEVADTDIAGLSGLDSSVVADLNGDGSPDVATTGIFSTGSPATARSRTNILAPTITGRYVQTAAIDMPVSMWRINAVDVDGDALNDLILLGDSNRAYVMYQVFGARGTFRPPRQL
ncbi:MAG: FG-GAP repeat domain-containing protein [Burkholderiaceae bacterium]